MRWTPVVTVEWKDESGIGIIYAYNIPVYYSILRVYCNIDGR